MPTLLTLALVCCQSDSLTVGSSYLHMFQGTRSKCGEIRSEVALIFLHTCKNCLRYLGKHSKVVQTCLAGPGMLKTGFKHSAKHSKVV